MNASDILRFPLVAYTKEGLKRTCRENNLKKWSKLSKSDLIRFIHKNNIETPVANPDNLLKESRMIFESIKSNLDSLKIGQDSSKMIELFKAKILALIGNSLSRLPVICMDLDNLGTKKKNSIQMYIDAFENLHEILDIEPICDPQEQVLYNHELHDGPEGLQEGKPCVAMSLGFKQGEEVVKKAIVEEV